MKDGCGGFGRGLQALTFTHQNNPFLVDMEEQNPDSFQSIKYDDGVTSIQMRDNWGGLRRYNFYDDPNKFGGVLISVSFDDTKHGAIQHEALLLADRKTVVGSVTDGELTGTYEINLLS